LHWHNIVLHALNLGHIPRKTSPSLTVNQWVCPQSQGEAVVFTGS
jgi:hypothetical protein